MNRHYLTLSSVRIDPRYLDMPLVGLGDGIDLRDPMRPLVAQRRGLALAKAASSALFKLSGLPRSSEVIQETTVWKESLSEHEESSVLSSYFKASYMLSSAQGSYEAARQIHGSYRTVYSLLEHSGEADRLEDGLCHWRNDEVPLSEAIADRDQALQQFVMTYGSHYVSALKYGLRIAVQGKLRKDGNTTETQFSAAVKAAFGSFSADVGVRNAQKQKLESMAVDLLLEATTGGHSGAGLLVVRGFDDIAAFLDDVKNDRIEFSVAPIEMTLKPFWAVLKPSWTRTRAALDPSEASFKVPVAPYGVPKGTILAWRPTADFVRGLEPNSPEQVIVPPDGWALCDGARGTPDLRGRFIRGTVQWLPVPVTGGAETHQHTGSTLGNTDKRGAHGGAGASYNQPAEVHTHGITADRHLPPFVDIVYIMKLDELP
jgi:hypothetical protein